MASPERPRYTRIPGTEEVVKLTRPGEEKCDFCSSSDPTFAYAAGQDDVPLCTTYEEGKGTTDRVAYGDWLACGTCADVVDRRDPQALAKTAARRIERHAPVLRNVPAENLSAARRDVVVALRDLYARLFLVLGPRRPWAPTPGAPAAVRFRCQAIRHSTPDPGESGAN